MSNWKQNQAAIAAARKNLATPAIRNVIRQIAETVKPAIIPPAVVVEAPKGPSSEDQTVKVKSLREGIYYPGWMGDPTQWKELEVTMPTGEVILCWWWDRSGDDRGLDLECSDLNDIEADDWWEGEEYTYKLLLPVRDRDYRPITAIMEELKRAGSVTLQ